MICEQCNERPATLHFTKVVNGEKSEVHLCDTCAQEKGQMSLFNGNAGFSINDLLGGLLNGGTFHHSSHNAVTHREELRCPKCHMIYQQFVEIGRFGCSECYKTFKNHLVPVLKRLHSGNIVHTGKIPKKAGGNISLKKRIEELKQDLKQSIEQEEFERAANIRDEVRALEKEVNNGQEGGGQS
ncbi:protein arginine kinase activator [Peribacillus deserti]|uniref:Protein arginine kinase activator n=1 Tax=Peribacillus deserti TaxID=673318 RepID=A0ABS2QMC3_9BACI|nr:UvrB/UvrC motif-containing protein [Peribacillus deserti]MBM7694327.1 protein arginine kinase activator [Peribacillus deserti]